MYTISTLQLPMPLGMGLVNCYLIQQDGIHLLIDTGASSSRKQLLKALESANCTQGTLKWIVLTHGDFDHSGNAAHLSKLYHVPVGMHPGDAGMVASGDMFVNRRAPNLILRKLIPMFTGFGQKERFTPDRLFIDGEMLNTLGFDAQIISIPGHSAGSIGILTSAGDLFCGDLYENIKIPQLNSIMDDPDMAQESQAKIRNRKVKMLYPGHGSAFPLTALS